MDREDPSGGKNVHRAPRPSSPPEVLDIVADKGVGIDAQVPVSLLGIDLATITARVSTAGVDTHLRYAEEVDRLDLRPEQKPTGVPELLEAGIELLGEGTEGTAKTAKKKQLSGPAERVEQLVEKVTGGGDEDEGEDENRDEDEDRGVPVEQLVEKVIGGGQLDEKVTDPVGQLVEKVIGGGQLDEKVTDPVGQEDEDEDRDVPTSRRPPSRG